jgi:hypothetical protein
MRGCYLCKNTLFLTSNAFSRGSAIFAKAVLVSTLVILAVATAPSSSFNQDDVKKVR